LFLACYAWVLGGALTAAEPPLPGGLQAESLRVGFTRSAFLSVNRNDAEAAFRVFTRTVGQNRGYSIEATVQVFENSTDLAPVLRDEGVNLLILDTWTYLDLDARDRLEPRFVSSDQGRVARRFLVLTRRNSGLGTLAELEGKSLNLLATANAELGQRWLASVLQGQGLGDPADFFGTIEPSPKPTTVVLPVFFGKKHACLIDSTGFELMTEMNPQVGKDLQTVVTSEPLVTAVICLSAAGWSSDRFRRDLIEALAELHLEPAGQQILTLFKTGQLMPFDESQLDTVRQLRAQATAERLATRPGPDLTSARAAHASVQP